MLEHTSDGSLTREQFLRVCQDLMQCALAKDHPPTLTRSQTHTVTCLLGNAMRPSAHPSPSQAQSRNLTPPHPIL